MGLDSSLHLNNRRSVGRRKEEADKKRSFVIWMKKKGGTIKKRGPSHATQQQRPGCADWPSILSQKKKKKLRNDAHRVKEPNPFEVMSRHTLSFHKKDKHHPGDRSNKNGRRWGPLKKFTTFFGSCQKRCACVCVKTKKKNRKIRRESSNAPRAMLTCYRVPKQQRV